MEITNELRERLEVECQGLLNDLLAQIQALETIPTDPIVAKVTIRPNAFEKVRGVSRNVEGGPNGLQASQ
jgi:hypothetical protein